jgi:hypothetical protein
MWQCKPPAKGRRSDDDRMENFLSGKREGNASHTLWLILSPSHAKEMCVHFFVEYQIDMENAETKHLRKHSFNISFIDCRN